VAVLDPLYAEVLMPFERFSDFSKGQELTISLPFPINSSHKANITIIDPASGTFRMRLELPNKNHAIPAGVLCQLKEVI
jgi:hypothetical protein